jgi:hypothetical protein
VPLPVEDFATDSVEFAAEEIDPVCLPNSGVRFPVRDREVQTGHLLAAAACRRYIELENGNRWSVVHPGSYDPDAESFYHTRCCCNTSWEPPEEEKRQVSQLEVVGQILVGSGRESENPNGVSQSRSTAEVCSELRTLGLLVVPIASGCSSVSCFLWQLMLELLG